MASVILYNTVGVIKSGFNDHMGRRLKTNSLITHHNNGTIMYKTFIAGFTKTTEYSPKGGLQLSKYIYFSMI